MDITKYGSQLSIALEQATVLFRQAQNTLTRLGRCVAEKSRQLQEALRPTGNYLWRLSRRRQNTLTIVRRSAVDALRSLQETIRARQRDVLELQATSLGTIKWTKDKIIEFRSQLLGALGQLTQSLKRGQDALTRLGRSVADKPRRLERTLQSRNNELRELLASSVDAIVVTNADRSLVAANSKALDLLGVTQTNMKQFTIDAFLSRGQIQRFDGQRLPFTRWDTSGKCKIRRLDGSLRVVEYNFVANFTPFRHLCSFRNITATNQIQPVHRIVDRKTGQYIQEANLQGFIP